jgi:dihydroxyacetone kinase-like predicted kinase
MIMSGAAAIDSHKVEINELNVFPVPDGDTGTNMSLTMGAGASALADSAPGTIGRAAEITAGALLRGARGNSGVILSLLFRGIARHLKDMDSADAIDFASAITFGVDSAYKAVMKPAEGTILTVSRLAAGAAVTEAEREEDIEAVLERALKVGYEALANTINLNPVLKKAGVIDAGGKGYLYILEGMLKALQGNSLAKDADVAAFGTPSGDVKTSTDVKYKADFSEFDTKDIHFTYCTEFIVGRKTKKDVNLLRDFLDVRGDSLVVVDDEEIIKVHVHSNEPGIVLTEALTYGPLVSVKVENMREQHTGKLMESAPSLVAAEDAGSTFELPPSTPSEPVTTIDTAPSAPVEPEAEEAISPVTSEHEADTRSSAETEADIESETPADTDADTPENDRSEAAYTEDECVVGEAQKQFGVVAVCAGEGMANVFRDLGADNIIIGGQTMNPSTEDILTQIEATPADTVFVLPNNKNIIMAAQQCMRLTDKTVIVIPAKTMPQGISALIAFDTGASVGENVRLMSIAIGRVHTAQITYAARDSTFDGQIIRAGDYLALIEDTLVATGKDSAALVDAIAYSLSQYAPEFITIFYGEDVNEATAGEVLKRLTAAIPEAETSVVYGGQPVYYFLISAE